MFKSIEKNNVQVVPFIAQKTWNIQNINNDDLILWISGSLSGSIAHTYIDYGDESSAPITNSYCNIALQQQSNQLKINYHQGINHAVDTFFSNKSMYYNSASNPVNADGTYKTIVYNTNKNLFYNTYDDPTKILGIENINLSTENRVLTDTMEVFNIPTKYFGEKIVPNSVKIQDTQLDQSYIIVDQGNTNLIISGSYFDKIQEISNPN